MVRLQTLKLHLYTDQFWGEKDPRLNTAVSRIFSSCPSLRIIEIRRIADYDSGWSWTWHRGEPAEIPIVWDNGTTGRSEAIYFNVLFVK